MKNTIGIFDSGLGGLTVLREVRKRLPLANLLYLGDTARVPYGTRSPETVIHYAKQDAKFLEGRGVSRIVIACHTASAYATHALKEMCGVPVMGVVEAAVKKAVEVANGDPIGIIGTDGTINSHTYQNEIRKIDKNHEVFAKACPLFVPLAEEGWVDDDVTVSIARRYLSDIKTKISVIILACTHYPLLKNAISAALEHKVQIVDPAEIVAENLQNSHGKLEGSGSLKMFATDVSQRFSELASRFLGGPIAEVERVDVDMPIQSKFIDEL